MAHEPTYTWTFSERSFVMRFFLWLYQANRQNLTFCKLFWGMIAVPITLPVVLFIYAVKGIATVFIWPFDKLVRKVSVNSAARKAAHIERWTAWKAEAEPFSFRMGDDAVYVTFRNEVDKDQKAQMTRYGRSSVMLPEHKYYLSDRVPKSFDYTPPEPKPAKVNAPTRIAEGMGALADRIVAWFQNHPGIGQSVSTTTTYIGRGLVYFVFYPLMFLVPLSAVSFGFYEIYTHREGAINGFHQAWSAATNAGHLFIDKAWIVGLSVIGMGIFLTGLGIFTWWALLAAEKMEAPRKGTRLYSAVGANRPPSRIGILIGNVLASIGTGLGWFVWWSLVVIFSPFWLFGKYVAPHLWHGTKRTGQFMVLGHHSVKNRTCPRIEVVKEIAK